MARCPRCHRRIAGATCPTDGTIATAASVPEPPAPELPGRTLAALIGAGGTAGVWAVAGDAGLAVKVPHLRTDVARERLIAEATAMRLVGAPPAPRLIEIAATTDGRPALVMERLLAPTLAAVLAELPVALPAGRALALAGAIADAVGRLHAAGLVHRDLKPENVVCGDGAVRILDLGLALGAHRAPAGTFTIAGAGTLEYAAPEQLRGDPIDVRADVYALGAIVFELLALRPPFVGDAAAIRTGHLLMWPPRLDELVPAPPALVDLIARCLDKDPARRPRDAAALATELPRTAGWTPAATVIRRAPMRTRADTTAALIAIEGHGRGTASAVARVVGEHGGYLARRAKDLALAVFEPDASSPLDRALRAAHQLVDAGVRRATVHVAAIRIRSGSRLGATGDALDRPQAWLPAQPDHGVVLSAAALAARRPGRDDVPLFGRDDELAVLRGAAAAVFAGDPGPSGADAGPAGPWYPGARCAVAGRPTLIVGASGSGRSRMLREAAAIATAAGASVIVIEPGPHRLRALAAAVGVDSDEPLPVMAALGVAARDRRLAVIVDDAEPTDDAAALLARSAETMPMWLCLAGEPALAHRLRGAAVIELAPLPPEPAAALVAALLDPCVVPVEARARLAAWGDRLPGVMVELAAALRAMGVVHPVPGSGLWELDAARLEQVPASVPRRWLSDRQLDALPAPLAELARIAATVATSPATEIDEVHLAAVLRELVRGGVPASSLVDPATGLTELARRGLLVPRGHRLGFAGETHRTAIAAGLDAGLAAAVHRAALALALDDTPTPDRLRRIAIHAGAIGDRAAARAAHVELAAAGELRHAHLDVERHLTAALELVDADADRRRLLLARARARRMSTRYEAARDDLVAVRAAATAAACVTDELEAVLALAAICDQTEQYAEADALVTAAGALADRIDAMPIRLAAFLHNRRGVIARRAGRIAEAADELERVRAAAGEADPDVVRGSLLLLSRVLANLGRSDAGLAVLDEAIDACAGDGDHFHLVAGLLNRITFWSERGQLARAVADAERGRAIARDMGLVQLAVWIDHNLSIALWWAGDVAGAMAAARRGHDAGSRRFVAAPSFTGTMQLAMFEAAAGRIDAALPLVERIRRSDAATGAGGSLELLELACGLRDPSGWPAALAIAAAGTPQDHVEALWVHAGFCRACADRDGAAAALTRATELARERGAGLAAVLAAELAALA